MYGIDLKKHNSLSSSVYIQELFNPILEPIGITYFNYIKIHSKDCSRELLTNNPEWIDHFYQNSLFNSIGAVDVEHLLPKGYFLWSELDIKDPIYLQGREFFNIDNGISFVIKREDVTFLYIFASHKDNHAINNFYAGNIDLLQRFIHYFNDKAQHLIKQAERHRIYLPFGQKVDPTRVNNIILSEKIRSNFIEKTETSRYYLLNENDNLYLTKQQAECSRLLISGLSSKHIAKKLNISHRTVEGFISAVKNKLQNSLSKSISKSNLIEILKAANLK